MKLGAEGALWTDGSDEVRGAGRCAVAGGVLDTTGAGDAFAAGLLAARLARRRAGGGARGGLRARRPGGGHAGARAPAGLAAVAPRLQASADSRRRRRSAAGAEPADQGDQRERQRQREHADQHPGEADQQVAGVVDRVVERAADARCRRRRSSATSRLTVTTA